MFAKDAGDAAHLTLAVEPGPERQEIPGKSVEQLQQVGLPLVPVGAGFQTLPKRLIDRIRASEYIDFAELLPAKGKSRTVSQAMEGQVLVVQATDWLQSRKIIPDLATWSQCFALYVAVLVPYQPTRIADLMAYQTIIAKASLKFKWPSWVVYDQNFRQEVSGNPSQSWAKVDPSMYALCFTGQAVSSENWCTRCQCLDHTSSNCPARPRKRPWSSLSENQFPPGQSRGSRQEQQVCLKYNRFDRDCKFGKNCRFTHVCSSCKEAHPVSRCKQSSRKDAGHHVDA